MKKKSQKVIIIRNRDSIIDRKLLKARVFVHNGKTDRFVKITRNLIGTKLGTLSMTKKMGKSIHDSAKNRKRKNKKTQKK